MISWFLWFRVGVKPCPRPGDLNYIRSMSFRGGVTLSPSPPSPDARNRNPDVPWDPKFKEESPCGVGDDAWSSCDGLHHGAPKNCREQKGDRSTKAGCIYSWKQSR